MRKSRGKNLSFRLERVYSLLVILTLLHNSIFAQAIDKRAHNQDTRIDTPASLPQDPNQESSDRTSAYDLSNSSETREDESEESSYLPPPNELSVIRLNDTSVVLRWEFADTAQEHLQYFKVQHRYIKTPKEWRTDDTEIAPTIRAYQINGLRPGNIQFCVRAVYDNNDNIGSELYKYRLRARSKIKPEEMPEMKAPEIYWHEAKSDYFRFKWKYEPKERDHEFFGYLVYYRSAHIVSDFTIYNTMDSNVEIADVEPDTPYEAKVVAYNPVGVSNFSDTLIIRTEPQQNATSTASTTTAPQQPIAIQVTTSTLNPSPSTTRRPLTVSWPVNERDDTHTTTTLASLDFRSTTTHTPRPNSNPPTHITNTTSSTTAKDIFQSITTAVNMIIGDQSDAMLIIRYLLLVLLPITLIVSVLICLIRGPSLSKKRNTPPSSTTTDDSMEFDLEINDYFKNSFPGSGKAHSPVASNNDVHHGFVNNHPHIGDFS